MGLRCRAQTAGHGHCWLVSKQAPQGLAPCTLSWEAVCVPPHSATVAAVSSAEAIVASPRQSRDRRLHLR